MDKFLKMKKTSHLRFLISLLVLVSALTPSCTHKVTLGQMVTDIPVYKMEFDFSDPQKLREYLQKFDDFKITTNQDLLIKILVAYSTLKKEQKNNKLSLVPYSKTRLAITSFCASSNKAIPEGDEVFYWVYGSPDVPLLKETLSWFNKNPLTSSQNIQELIWNLENRTSYEDYPDYLKKLIGQISPSAPLILPSRLKERITEKVIPQKIKVATEILRGQYYSYNDFKEVLERKKSNLNKPAENSFSKLPNTEILATTRSKGYKTQIVTFYNPSSSRKIFKLENYYLKSVRKDVQPVVLASTLPYNDDAQKTLEEYALKLLGYLGSKYLTLNSSEKTLVEQNPIDAAIVFYNAVLAERNGEKFYPNSGPNGASDSFRHFVWAGLLTRDLGEEKARQFLDAHEHTPGQSAKEKEMDTFNNERGIEAAKTLLKNGDFENATLYNEGVAQIKEGRLKILNHEGRDKGS